MTRLAHISDLHFGTTDSRLVEALAGDIRGFSPNLTVVTGDLTQRAKHRQFQEAATFLRSLPEPRLVIPGNHDIAPLYRPATRLLDPFRRFRAYFGDRLDNVFVDEKVLVFGLNTVDPLRWKEGKVSWEQIAWLTAVSHDYPGRFGVLAAHHPLVHVEPNGLAHPIERSAPLLQALPEIGIELVLTGHLHQGFSGRAASSFDSSGSLLVAQASTATSSRLRGHSNGYNRIVLAVPQISIELRVWDGDRFRTEAMHEFLRGPHAATDRSTPARLQPSASRGESVESWQTGPSSAES